ncbi:HAD family phosphatase [Patescibacteria group bacterium]|nr:HAD family phosphatase [Patescibacteria group bacterium]
MKKQSEIKGIIFDLGGVLIKDSGVAFIKYASGKLKIEPKKLGKVIRQEADALGRGEETTLEFWHRVCCKLGIKCPSDKILQTLWVKPYKQHAKIKKGMFGLIKGLGKRYKTAILSNTIKEHSQINRERGLFDFFDEVLLSDEVGLRKPEKKFFGEASKRLGIPLKNMIFIDDDIRWVKAARKYGLDAILFKNKKQLVVALKRRGVLRTQK